MEIQAYKVVTKCSENFLGQNLRGSSMAKEVRLFVYKFRRKDL